MCDCFHLAFPNWHAASSGTGAARRARGPESGKEDESICDDEPPQFTEGERPRPQGSSPVEEFPETEKYTDSDKECEAEHDPHQKRGKKTKKSGFGSMFDKHSTPKMSKLKEVHSPESGVIVKTAKDGCAEGLIYGGGGKEGIFIKDVVPESPASKSLKLKQGDQVLSATVYFDNVSYEDAIQILEHAQAYKVKLCLKRQPDITETEPVIESDVIPEEDLFAPEMREQEKTKRRGDTRISWPKFPSFGKGRKSRFTRSHSSSEAEDQRKLELSPSTSYTESPIKSQDALKGKKRHKIKLSVLTRKGRVSSSEEQDTDTPTTGQISGVDIHQTQEASDSFESPPGETPEAYATDVLTVVEGSDLRVEENQKKLTEPETVQHKVELITIDSTMKTTDLTTALTDQESSSPIKSPDGKKKKKEKSELKMKILGRDKLKKDSKAKSSPKRLKTLGASIEKTDQPENQKSDVIPVVESNKELQGDQLMLDTSTQIISSESPKAKSVTPVKISVPQVELGISDIALVKKSPKKGEEKTKKGKGIKQKQDTKTSPTFKLPKVGFSDIATEETIQKINVNVEESKTNIKQFTTEGKDVTEDPYDKLSKSTVSGTQLPKREDIEIPGMEDVSKGIKAKGIKVPKAVFTGPYEEIQSETVQMSIDVNSVKEAVSKLPGFKLPKVDTFGMQIPEEITVIDANAQRISVKTPTKVVDTKTKQEAHVTKFDVTASPEIPKTSIKLPKIKPEDVTSEELVSEVKVDLEKESRAKQKQSNKDIKTGFIKQEDIIIIGKESPEKLAIHQTPETEKTKGTGDIKLEYELTTALSSKESDNKSKKAKIAVPSFGIAIPDIRIPNIGIDFSEQKRDEVKGERTTFLHEGKMSKTERGKDKRQLGGVMPDIKIPAIETSAMTTEGELEAPRDDFEYIDSVGGSLAMKDGGIRHTGFGVKIDAAKAKADVSFPEIRGEIKDVEAEEHINKLPKFGAVIPDISENVPDAAKDINIDGAEIKTLEKEGKGSKFKMPGLSISMPKVKGPKMDVGLTKTKTDVDVRLTEDITLASADVSIPEQKLEIKNLQSEGDFDGQGSKFKIPKFGIKMPKMKGPGFDLSLSKKDVDVTLPKAKRKKLEVKKPELEIKNLQSEGDLDGGESKFKIPKFGIKMPKMKGPEFDLSLSKKDVDVTLPEAKSEVKLSEAPDVDVTLGKVDVSIPGKKLKVKKPELEIQPLQIEGELDGQGSKFKMPKLGFAMPKKKGPEFDLSLSKKDIDVPKATAKVKFSEAPDVDATLGRVDVSIPEQKLEVKKPESEIQPLQIEGELGGQGSKFKMPKFGIKIPKIKGPEFDLSSSKKDMDVSEATAEVKFPEAPEIDITHGKIAISSPELKMEVEKSLETEGELDGQGGKFKMPKFGIKIPKIKGPEFDLSLSKKGVDVPEATADVKFLEAPEIDITQGTIDVSIPEQKLGVEKPQLDIKPLQIEGELDGQGGKFKMPKFGIKMPKVKGPEIDFSTSKKDVDITLPEAKAEVKLPDVELKGPSAKVEIKAPETRGTGKAAEGSPLKFKMPTFKLPKFGTATPNVSVQISDKNKDIQIPETQLKTPEDGGTVGITVTSTDIESPSLDVKTTAAELDGKGGKFKMPKFGISLPKVKGPEIDLSLSNKDVDATLPESEVKLPDVDHGFKVKLKAPEIEVHQKDVEGSPSNFKISAEVPDIAKDFKIDGSDINISGKESVVNIATPSIDIEGPSIDMKTTGTEHEGKGSKFKMPKLGMSMPHMKGPEIHFGLSKKDADVTLPEAKAEVKLPDIELKESKPLHTEVELEREGSKFKTPKFGMSVPKVKVPEIDLSLSKKGIDVTLPDAKAGVELPDAPTVAVDMKPPECEAEIDGHGSKFKMPKFGITMPKVKGPEIDLSFMKKDVDVSLPDSKVEVDIKAPAIEGGELKTPKELELEKHELEILSESELDGQGKKFKMPKFGMSLPKVKGPEIDVSLSKKDVDATLPEASAEVNQPDVELKEPSAKVEMKAPEIEAQLSSVKGSPSRFKMPTFKFPKFGAATPNISVEVPDIDKDIKIDGADMEISVPQKDVDVPEVKTGIRLPEVEVKGSAVMEQQPGVEVDAKLKKPRFSLFSFSKSGKAPEVDVSAQGVTASIPEGKVELKGGEVDMKPPECEAEIDSQGSKFKMPKFGLTMPKLTGPETDLSLSKKDVDVTLPEANAEVQLPDIEVKVPSAKVKIKAPGIDILTSVEVPDLDKDIKLDGADLTLPAAKAEVKIPDVEIKEPTGSISVSQPPVTEGDAKLRKSSWTLPKFSFSKTSAEPDEADLDVLKVDVTLPEAKTDVHLPDIDIKLPKVEAATPQVSVEVPDLDKDIKLDGADLTLPEAKAEVKIPDVEIKEPTGSISVSQPPVTEGDAKLRKSNWAFPKFSFSKTSAKPTEADVKLDVPKVDVTLPEAKTDVQLPDINIKQSSGISTEEEPATDLDAKLKKTRFSLPKLSFSKQSTKQPEVDISVPDVDVSLPEGNVEVKQPELDLKAPEGDAELDGEENKFKMPEFGISKPKLKGPEINLSLSKKDVDVTLPESEVQLPDVQTGHVEGSQSEFKMPTFTLPKFGTIIPKVSVEVPDVKKDIQIGGAKLGVTKEGAAVDVTAPSIDTEGLSVDVKAKGIELEGSGSKFKMPKFGFPVPQVKAPEIDLSLSKKDVDVTLPEAKAEVQLPDIEVKVPSAKVEIKAPGIDVQTTDVEGSPSTFNMPTFKIPKFGVSIPQVSVEVPDLDKDIKVDGADLTLPEAKAEVKIPDVEIKEPTASISVSQPPVTEGDAKLRKSSWAFPKFSFSKTSAKPTEADVKLDVPKVDVTLPEAKTDVQLPDINIKQSSGISTEEAPATDVDAKLKKPRFSLPKLSFSKQSTKQPEVDISVPDVDVSLPEGNVEVKQPELDLKAPEGDAELDGHESKFKMPEFDISKPKLKGPEINLSLSKKDVDVTLPESEVQLPDVQTGHVEGSQSELKMPTFTLPKFGTIIPKVSVEVPDVKKDIQIGGAKMGVTKEGAAVDVTAPIIDTEGLSVDVKTKGIEHEGKGSKFKMPNLGFSVPQVKAPEIDLSLSKKDVDVTLPEVKAEERSAKVEIKAPGIDVQTTDVEGSPSTFKMPTFKLPKFGVSIPQVNVEVPDLDKDIKVDGADLTLPAAKAEVKLPDVEIKEPTGSISVSQPPVTEGDAKLRKSSWTLPKFSFSKTSAKPDEADLDVLKVDVTLPEAKTDVHLPDIDIKLPKVEAATTQVSVEVPDLDKDIKLDGADLTLPEAKAEVKIPDVEIKEPTGSISVSQPPVTEGDAKLRKSSWTLPKFSFSKTSAKPDEADLDVPKVDVTLPEAKTDVHLPDIDIKQTSGISTEEAPATDLDAKLKKTRFSLPKLSFSKQGSKEPEVDFSVLDVDVSLPEGKLEVKKPEVEIKATEGDAELDGQESKFKMPKFGMSKPKLNVSVSKKDSDVKLPEAEVQLPDVKMEIKAPEHEAPTGNVDGSPSKFKMPSFTLPRFGASTPNVSVDVPDVKKDIKIDGEVQLPDVKMKKTSAKMEVKAPETETQKGNVEGSPSKLKMPTFTLPKFGAATPKARVEVPDVNKDIKIDGAKQEVPKEGATVDSTASGSKFKMPKFGISMTKAKGAETDLSSSKKDVEVPLPEAKAKLPNVKVKQPSAKMEMKTPETEAQTGNVEGSPSKLKMPTFTLPKFGAATPKVSVDVPDVNKDIKIDGAKLEISKEGATVDGTASGSKFKMPKFGISMPKVKETETDLSSSKKDVEVPLPKAKADVKLLDVKVKQPEAAVSVPDVPVEEEAKLKQSTWAFPRFSFSRTGGNAPDVDVNLETPKVDVTSSESKAEVSVPDVEVKGHSIEEPPAEELDAILKKPRFSLPRFSFSKSSVKEPEGSADLAHVDVSLPEGEVKVKLPEVQAEVKLAGVKELSTNAEIKTSETETKSKDVGGSPLKFKTPKVKFGTDIDKDTETDGAKIKDDVTVNITGPSVDIKTDASKAAVSDSEPPKTETDSVGLASPSKFKFWLNFSKPKPEDEHVSVDTEGKDNQLEIEAEPTKGESISPKMTLTSFGEILKNIDVEFDVPKTEQEEENLDTSKEVHGTDELKKQEAKGKETNTKPDTTKSAERTGWFKFPRFGLSSPSEPAKISEKDEQKDEKSPVGETVDEEISPTISVQSSDAFADISSAMTSEHVGLSSSSPTKVTVKYSDPNFATGLENVHGNIITSTTRTGMISVEPNLPEKITILSSSSEDTLRLESGKIHIITSNIQATPETQQARLLTAAQVQSAGDLPLQSEGTEAASWTVEKSQSSSRTVFEKHLVKETSSDGQETTVITKQITHVFDSAEPISDETATSIQRLRDTVHSEKMKFFDGAGK
ncbi:neuroblast differentiation-associated protein AHNAK-like [Scomber scombrus]|uniref:Neuroblast differentiation-associated protein AHNAK-like n=1 Tax=Scomber scombrus TaxID=13677 RepID=A0AAV1P4H1_SCOSC